METTAHKDPSADLDPARLVLLLATVLVGLSAGFFYTYEASVTLGLAEVSDVGYVETFQAINETIRNAGFALMFFGAIPVLALAAALNWGSANRQARLALIAGLAFYLTGLAITATGNVPLNEQLAELTNVTTVGAGEARAAFEDSWNRLNLIRTVTFVGSFICVASVPFLSPKPAERSGFAAAMKQNR
ncbi:MAG: DUF1772 domain-containing protein [Acidimicrobiales bacterium]